MSEASAADDKYEFLVLNARFHGTILEASGHRRLLQFASLVRVASQALYGRLGLQPLRHQLSAREHREILEALRSRNSELAERVARIHIRRAADHWLKPGTDGEGDRRLPPNAPIAAKASRPGPKKEEGRVRRRVKKQR